MHRHRRAGNTAYAQAMLDTHTPPGRLIFRCPSPWGQSSHHSAEATENGVVRGPIVPWEGSRLGLAGFMSAVLICVAVPVLGEEGSV